MKCDSSAAAADTSMMASSAPGSFLDMRGVSTITSSDTRPVTSVTGSMRPRLVSSIPHLGRNCPGRSRRPRPRKSLTWVVKMVRAIPAVKPTTMGYGINLMTVPSLKTPISISIRPAMAVATARPVRPYWAIILYTITINAPVGPPICTEQPPKNDTMKPPMMAVTMPMVGLTPDAIPKAMASGKATMPTTMPAMMSARRRSLE